jgi:hypothetical protein
VKRGAPLERKRMKRTRTTNGAFDADTRELAASRAGFLCELCGVNRIEQFHHRRPRGAGGGRSPETSSVSNCLPLCMADHALVESNRTWAMQCGYLVSQFHNPSEVAAKINGRFVFLTTDGGYGEVPDVA